MTGYAYGATPEVVVSDFRPAWFEYMHYLYLPVVIPERGGREVRLPERLLFLQTIVESVVDAESEGHYVYVTARRGYASPGNPLNRPGWHADGFGSDDVNYIWSDRWPTRFAVGEFEDISDDHVRSAKQFEEQISYWQGFVPQQGAAPMDFRGPKVRVVDGEPHAVYRLDPSVVHATPIISAPGGDRSFFKVSVSPNRYNLLGNSHNYLFDYEWEMWSRETIRNDPAYAGGDAGPQEVER